MKPFYFLLLLFIFSYTPLYPQILLEENFENGIPGGWTSEAPWTYGNAETLTTNSFFNNFPVPAHTHFLGLNDDRRSASASADAMLITPVIDLSQIQEPVVLTFDAFYPNLDFYGDETATVLISTDGTISWEELYRLDEVAYGADRWQKHGIQIGGVYLGQQIYLAFHYNDDNGHNTGLAIDNVKLERAPQYMALAYVRKLYKYTIVSPNQYPHQPFQWELTVNNLGASSLDNLTLKKTLSRTGGGNGSTTSTLPVVAPGSIRTDTVRVFPEQIGNYRLFLILSEENIDGNLLAHITSFTFSDSELAQDDGGRESGLGFGFGDPSWYGYYGTVFQLEAPDTLVGISVDIANSSGISGSINFIVHTFDESGVPSVVQYHSEAVELNNSPGWAYHELPGPFPLDAGYYLFAAGQDTVQGVIGFNFDHQPGDGNFWIISPIAGGGYPWSHSYRHPYRLMIRPHFQVPASIVKAEESTPSRPGTVRIWPNPASHWLNLEFKAAPANTTKLRIRGLNGQLWQEQFLPVNKRISLNVEQLPPGLYLVEVQLPDGRREVQKLVKM